MSTFFVTFQIVEGGRGLRAEEAAIAAAVTFSGYMVSRGVAEGLIDSNRGPTKADVGQ
jgi:fucose permease